MAHTVEMDKREEQARMHDQENRAEMQIRREEHSMEAGERTLERELKAFDEAEAQAKKKIEAELRTEHQGHEPERRPAWLSDEPEADPPVH